VLDNLLLVIAALLLVLLNGFFVAAEFGLVKLRQTRIRSIAKSSGLRGKLLVTVHQHLDTYLSACQLGITLASLGLGWIGEPAFANLLQPLFHVLGVTSVEIIHGVSFFLLFRHFFPAYCGGRTGAEIDGNSYARKSVFMDGSRFICILLADVPGNLGAQQ
jgi:CBS domain containing-hemolysin-like protein